MARGRNATSFVGESYVKCQTDAGDNQDSGDSVTVDSGKCRSLKFPLKILITIKTS